MIDIDFIIVFVKWMGERYSIFYCPLNYDDNLILVMFTLKCYVLSFFSQLSNH